MPISNNLEQFIQKSGDVLSSNELKEAVLKTEEISQLMEN